MIFNKLSLSTYAARRALGIGLAVFVAVIINFYFSFSKEGWIILTAYLMGQTTRGTPLRQGLIYFFIIIIIAGLLPPYAMDIIRSRILDVIMGALIGVILGQFFFPVKVYKEFSVGVIPLLQAFLDYSQEFLSAFVQRQALDLLPAKIARIEESLTGNHDKYPDWVYEVGFNRNLRAGFRFFLINLERVSEIFFSLNYLAHAGLDTALLKDFSPDLTNVVRQNNELLAVLIKYFAEGKLTDIKSEFDFTSDIIELEKKLNSVLPSSLELLDMSHDYMTLIALVRDLKDLRQLLLQLAMALPTTFMTTRQNM